MWPSCNDDNFSVINQFCNYSIHRVTEGEGLQSVRTRMLERLEIPEKEFEKYKFVLVSHGRMTPLSEDFKFNSSDFIPNMDKDNKPRK